MKGKSLKTMMAAFAVFFGALVASPAWAECSLCQPARSGNLVQVQEIAAEYVANGGAIDDLLKEHDEKERTPLYNAVSQNRNDVAEYLLEEGASANAPNYAGRTPLMSAIKLGNDVLLTAF